MSRIDREEVTVLKSEESLCLGYSQRGMRLRVFFETEDILAPRHAGV